MKRGKEQQIKLNTPQKVFCLGKNMYYITININIVRYYISERYDGEYLDVDTGGML